MTSTNFEFNSSSPMDFSYITQQPQTASPASSPSTSPAPSLESELDKAFSGIILDSLEDLKPVKLQRQSGYKGERGYLNNPFLGLSRHSCPIKKASTHVILKEKVREYARKVNLEAKRKGE